MKALLVIADGLGWADVAESNAVSPETMPFLFGLVRQHGVARLDASGLAVGLGETQAGNSEAGHLTIGAGRCVPSLLTTIGDAYEDGRFAQSAVWEELEGAPCLHLVGLLSDAGVHGYWPNLVRAADLARQHGIEQVFVHALLDGAPRSAIQRLDLKADGEAETVGAGRDQPCAVRAIEGVEHVREFSMDAFGHSGQSFSMPAATRPGLPASGGAKA